MQAVRSLLKECQDFVKSALIERRQDQKKMEEQIIRSIQREADSPTETEKDRAEDTAKSIFEVVENSGIPISKELIAVLMYLDENFLHASMSEEEYDKMLIQLGEFLEEQD